MTGKSHVAVNVATALLAADAYLFCTGPNAPASLDAGARAVSGFLSDPGGMPFPVYVCAGTLLYLLGSLLPDADHPYSLIGKRVHVPVAHRTWLHAIYIPAALMLAGIWMRCWLWLGLGYFFHLFWDGFSWSGIHWFYPHKGKHRLKLYYTGKASEYVLVTVVWVAALALLGLWGYLWIRSGLAPDLAGTWQGGP